MPRLSVLCFAFLSLAASAQPTVGDSLADSLGTNPALSDTLAADTLAGNVVVLSDSARAELDSVAVASLADTTAAAPVRTGVWVTPFGRRPFQIWGGLGSFSPEARAERLTQRIEALATNRDADLDSLVIVPGNELTTIQLDDLIVMTVTQADAEGQGTSRLMAAETYLASIQEEVARYREQVTLRGLVRSAAIAAVLLILLVLTLRGLRTVYAWLGRRTARIRRLVVRPVRVGTFEVVGRDQVARLGAAAGRLARLATSLVVVYLFLTAIFGLFPWTQDWSYELLGYALAPLRQLGQLALDGAPSVLAIAVIVVVIRWLMKLSDYFFHQVERGEVEVAAFPDELAEPTRKIAKFLLVILAVMLIYPYTPIVDSPVFQGLTVFLGLLFTLGSSTAIANLVAGIVLTYSMAFRIGDRVKVGDTFGDVVDKSFLVTRIRTPKNEDVAVPNATVLSNHIINYSRMSREGEGVILHTTVTIGYDVPWPKVHALMTMAAIDTDGVSNEPAPFVLQTSLGDFSVAYELNAYTHEVRRMAALYSGLHQNIQTRFAEAGVEILSPVYHARRDGPLTVPDYQALARGPGLGATPDANGASDLSTDAPDSSTGAASGSGAS